MLQELQRSGVAPADPASAPAAAPAATPRGPQRPWGWRLPALPAPGAPRGERGGRDGGRARGALQAEGERRRASGAAAAAREGRGAAGLPWRLPRARARAPGASAGDDGAAPAGA